MRYKIEVHNNRLWLKVEHFTFNYAQEREFPQFDAKEIEKDNIESVIFGRYGIYIKFYHPIKTSLNVYYEIVIHSADIMNNNKDEYNIFRNWLYLNHIESQMMGAKEND